MDGIEELRNELLGEVLTADSPGFSDALSVWAVSAYHDAVPVPALVVQPRGTSDVIAAVKFATAKGLSLSVKGGGHGAGNPSRVDGGLMIDMSRHMHSVFVDPEAKTAVVDGGALAIDIDSESSLHGLAAPLGVCCVVGMGLALNGGLSLLSRAYGPACDGILEATVVLADGTAVHVTKDGPDPELWWALRGAGSSLGVVTKLKFQLHDVKGAYTGTFVWKDDPGHASYRAILHWIRDVVLNDTRIGFNCSRIMHPDLGPMLVSMVIVLSDEPDEAKAALLQPLRDLGPIQDTVGNSTWLQTQMTHMAGVTGVTKAFPVHYEVPVGGHVTAEQFNDEFIEAYIRCTSDELPLPQCALTLSFIELMGGKLKHTQAPVGLKEGELQWVTQVGWADASASEVGMRYAELLHSALGPLGGVADYVNMLDTAQDLGMTRVAAEGKVGGTANFNRLICNVKLVWQPYSRRGGGALR